MENTPVSAGRIVCFGEVLLRLSAPGHERLLQSPALEARFGGAEANAAVSLARFGHQAAVVSVLPDNPLGHAARDELRRHGVETSGVRFGPGRMGLYFLSVGAVLRPSQVTYDREGSAFARAAPGAVDWMAELEGAAWLHLSGVTPAIGPDAAQGAVRAVREARRLGVRVSYDGNYRATMWAGRQGDAPAILRDILESADLAFINERDIGLVLGGDFEGLPDAADAAFAAFPRLERIAATVRTHRDVTHQELSARMFTRQGAVETRGVTLAGVVDRIGAGDAFAAGVLHGLIAGLGERESLEFGLAAAVLKHSIPGDFNLIGARDVEDLLAGGGLDVKR